MAKLKAVHPGEILMEEFLKPLNRPLFFCSVMCNNYKGYTH